MIFLGQVDTVRYGTHRANPLRWVVVVCILALVLAGCSRGETEIKPPEIRFGEDKCADCDMIISEPRFAAAAMHDVGGGTYESLLFDDIGDLLRYMKENPDLKYVASYVHDYDTEAWVDASKAIYVQSSEIRTPMASGLAASDTQTKAEALATQFNGTVMDWTTLQERAPAPMPGMNQGQMNK